MTEVKEAAITAWPTRYTLVVLMLFTFVIAWADRVAFSVATPKIMSTFGWSRTQMGIIGSAFIWGFVLFKLPAGWLADRYGGMKTMVGGILFWSLVTVFFPFTTTLFAMGALRLLLGIGEITYPPSQVKMIARWFPEKERPTVNGVCLAASSVGNLAATPLAAWLLVAYNWHRVFYIFGVIGILWGLGVWRWGANPRTETNLNEQVHQPESAGKQHDKISWLRLLKIGPIWGLVLVYFCVTYCFWVFLNWLPTYLVEARGFTFLKMGFYAAVPFVAQGVAQVAAGFISTKLSSRGFSKNFCRKVIMGVCFGGASICLIFVAITLSPILAVVYISAALAFLGASYTPIWTLPIDMSSKWPGTIFGFVGTVGFLGGTVAPIVTGYIVDHTGSWHLAFYLASAISLIGLVGTLLFVSTDPIDAKLTA